MDAAKVLTGIDQFDLYFMGCKALGICVARLVGENGVVGIAAS
jgi:hypothetical protein